MSPPVLASVAVDALGAVAAALAVLLAGGAAWAGHRVHTLGSHERAALRRAEAAEAAEAKASSLADRLAGAERSVGRRERALDTLWSLAELEHGWQRRDEAALVPGAPPSSGPGLAGGLHLLLQQVRDEAGIPGELVVEVGTEPPPSDALLVFEALRVLLGAVARHCDHFSVEVSGGPSRVAAVLLGGGFDGGEATVEDARHVTRLLRAVGVEGTVAAAGGTLEARLTFPVAPPA